MDRDARIGLTALRLAGLVMIAGTVTIWIGAGLFDGCSETGDACEAQGREVFLAMLATSPLAVFGAGAVGLSLWRQAAEGARLNGPWRLLAWVLRVGLWLGGATSALIALAAPGEASYFAIIVSPFCAAVAAGAFLAARRITRALKAAPTL